jgi:hypothetical protein
MATPSAVLISTPLHAAYREHPPPTHTPHKQCESVTLAAHKAQAWLPLSGIPLQVVVAPACSHILPCSIAAKDVEAS